MSRAASPVAPKTVARLQRVLPAVVAVASVGYLVGLGAGGTPMLWAAVWSGALGLAAMSPHRPELAVAAYITTLYATPRYSQLFETLGRSGILHLEVALAVVGVLVWIYRSGQTPRLRGALVYAAVALFLWGTVSALVPRSVAWQATESVRHSTSFLVHAVLLLLVASQVMHRRAAIRALVLPLAAGLTLRMFWQGPEGLMLEGDIGPLTLMVLPLSLLLFASEQAMLVRSLILLFVLLSLGAVALTFNRTSAVTFAVVLAMGAWKVRQRKWLLAVGIVIGMLAATWMATTVYWNRFEDAWNDLTRGGQGSVTERFALWEAGLHIIQDYPILGVGPGNYDEAVSSYARELGGLVAHNSYVQVAAETGVPGLALYLTIFVLALHVSQRVANQSADDVFRTSAMALQVSLVAYLTFSLFISRHDMVLAYVLAGWLAALEARRVADTSDRSSQK